MECLQNRWRVHPQPQLRLRNRLRLSREREELFQRLPVLDRKQVQDLWAWRRPRPRPVGRQSRGLSWTATVAGQRWRLLLSSPPSLPLELFS